jgi:hypothetical protein
MQVHGMLSVPQSASTARGVTACQADSSVLGNQPRLLHARDMQQEAMHALFCRARLQRQQPMGQLSLQRWVRCVRGGVCSSGEATQQMQESSAKTFSA